MHTTQTYQYDLDHGLGIFVETLREFHLILEDLLECKVICSPAERGFANDELVDDTSKSPDIGSVWSTSASRHRETFPRRSERKRNVRRDSRLIPQYFGRDEICRPDKGPLLILTAILIFRIFALFIEKLGAAKIGDLDAHILIQQNTIVVSWGTYGYRWRDSLLRLEVAVDDTSLMHEFDRVEHESSVISGGLDIEGAVLRRESVLVIRRVLVMRARTLRR